MAQYTRDVLEKKTKSDLLEIAEELDLELESKINKQGIVEAILTAYESDDEVDDDEVEDDEVDDTDEVEETDDELDDIEDPVLDDEDEIEQDEVEEAPVKKTRTKKTTTKTEKSAGKEGDTLAAKQVAALVGTDAKTIRQFFRSAASTTEAVGSGGRYEFLETDVPKIKEEFEKWNSNRGRRAAGSDGSSSKKSRKAAMVSEEIEEVEEIEELEEAELDDLDEDDIELED